MRDPEEPLREAHSVPPRPSPPCNAGSALPASQDATATRARAAPPLPHAPPIGDEAKQPLPCPSDNSLYPLESPRPSNPKTPRAALSAQPPRNMPLRNTSVHHALLAQEKKESLPLPLPQKIGIEPHTTSGNPHQPQQQHHHTTTTPNTNEAQINTASTTAPRTTTT